MQASARNRTPGLLHALDIGAVFLLVGVVGFFFASEFTAGSTDDRFTESTDPDNFLHLITGGIALLLSTVGAARPREVAA